MIYRISLIFFVGSILFFACQTEQEKTAPSAINQTATTTTGNPAIDGLSVAIQENPNDAGLYAKRADLFYQNEGYDEAIADLQKALKIDSTNVDYLHLLADVYLDYYQSYNAMNTMLKAATLYPNRIPTLLKLSEFQLILKQYDKSINTINEILKLQPLHPEAYFMLGQVFKEQGDIDRAIGSFQTAVENDPDLVDGYVNLGQLHADKGSPLAKYYFDNAVKVAPKNVVALHAKAEYLHFSDQLPEAIELYKRINQIDPDYSESLFNTGIIYLEMDSLPQANTHFNMAVETSPTYIIAYYYRGLVAEKMGDKEAAKRDYQNALNLNPNFERAKAALEALK
ncbi:MAG: tetratricopeptide repeat protein [Bacteroidota bacterium]